MNIGSVLTTAARSEPERVAIIHGDLRRSYREFDERASRLASALRRAGLSAGDRVALLQRNGPELLESLFGIFKAGLIAVPSERRRTSLHTHATRGIVPRRSDRFAR